MSRAERKRKQIEHVPHISKEAKLVKLADKLYNCRDAMRAPPPGWDYKRVQGYIVWSKAVLQSAKNINKILDDAHDDLYNSTFTMNNITYPAIPKDVGEKKFLESYLVSM